MVKIFFEREKGGIRMRYGVSLLILLVLAGAFSACSYVLDIFANPDAPVFSLFVRTDGVRDSLSWAPSRLPRQQPENTDVSGQEKGWEMLFGYYVFVATGTPYDGYRLVARLLNEEIVDMIWTNHLWNSTSETWYETQVSFEPADALGYLGLANGYSLPISTSSRFYRVAVIALKRSVIEVRNERGERAGERISYQLVEVGVSGWVAP